MIQFIKSNSNFFIFFLLIFLTIDTFIVIFKVKNRFDSLPSLSISYDPLKSYVIKNNNHTFLFIYLTIKNLSKISIDIDIAKIKLINNSENYSLNFRDSINNNVLKLFCINAPFDDIITNTNITSYAILQGYVFFELSDYTEETIKYSIIISTLTENRTFKKEIVIEELNNK